MSRRGAMLQAAATAPVGARSNKRRLEVPATPVEPSRSNRQRIMASPEAATTSPHGSTSEAKRPHKDRGQAPSRVRDVVSTVAHFEGINTVVCPPGNAANIAVVHQLRSCQLGDPGCKVYVAASQRGGLGLFASDFLRAHEVIVEQG